MLIIVVVYYKKITSNTLNVEAIKGFELFFLLYSLRLTQPC